MSGASNISCSCSMSSNDAFNVHSVSISNISTAMVKRNGDHSAEL